MIVINRTETEITIKGHAKFAPHGEDIVCAAVSVLVQTFIASIEELTTDKINSVIGAGKAIIQHGNLSERGTVLLDSFLLGLNMISESFPDHVRIIA